MGAYARIVHEWAEGGITECEFATDEAVHVDLLDECVRRVLEMYRETVAVGED